MMKHYGLQRRVRDLSKPPILVAPVTLADPAVVEIIGFAGAEAVLIDLEHGVINEETMRSMLVHARAAGAAPTCVPVYETVPVEDPDRGALQRADVICFFAPSAVRAFQTASGIAADGRVGPMTKIRIYQDLGEQIIPALLAQPHPSS